MTLLSVLPNQAQQNQVVEIRWVSTSVYADPFKDVELEVVFTAPGGNTLRVPAFWAGGDAWCVRYASAETGTHSYRTVCSDEGNLSLHGQVGSVEIGPYRGDNLLYRHGGIQVADDRRHFRHADGTPFFWLGDTWWMALCGRLSWAEFQTLTQHRKDLGFTVVQLVAGFYPDMPLFDERGRSPSGFCWETDLSRVNPRFFDEADQRIFHLVEQGLVPCILGAWGFYLTLIGQENMQRHWRYLMARWGALPVVWVAAGEQTLPWYLESEERKAASRETLTQAWTQVVADMRARNVFARMVTTHPFPTVSARGSVTDPGLLDFEMQQTGHGSATHHQAARAWQGWNEAPVMPVIGGETRYEALEIQPTVTTRDVREAFWAHMLHSGLAGHTYGANGIWQVNTTQKPFGPSPNGISWGSLPWTEAMQLHGAVQLGRARRFLESIPWHLFQPLVVPVGPVESWSKLRSLLRRVLRRLGSQRVLQTSVAMGRASDGSAGLVYAVSGGPLWVDLSPFLQPVVATWVDPVSFETFSARGSQQGQRLLAQPPGRNAAGDADWLLLLQQAR